MLRRLYARWLPEAESVLEVVCDGATRVKTRNPATQLHVGPHSYRTARRVSPRLQHTVLHHSHTGVAHNAGNRQAKEHFDFDPDVRFSGVMRLSPDEEWLPHHRYQFLYAPLALGLLADAFGAPAALAGLAGASVASAGAFAVLNRR